MGCRGRAPRLWPQPPPRYPFKFSTKSRPTVCYSLGTPLNHRPRQEGHSVRSTLLINGSCTEAEKPPPSPPPSLPQIHQFFLIFQMNYMYKFLFIQKNTKKLKKFKFRSSPCVKSHLFLPNSSKTLATDHDPMFLYSKIRII